jgi:hypothetical protein
VEISLDIETKLFIKLSFAWFSLPLICIDNVPLLMDLVSLNIDTNVSVLLINVAYNFQNLSFLVYD